MNVQLPTAADLIEDTFAKEEPISNPPKPPPPKQSIEELDILIEGLEKELNELRERGTRELEAIDQEIATKVLKHQHLAATLKTHRPHDVHLCRTTLARNPKGELPGFADQFEFMTDLFLRREVVLQAMREKLAQKKEEEDKKIKKIT